MSSPHPASILRAKVKEYDAHLRSKTGASPPASSPSPNRKFSPKSRLCAPGAYETWRSLRDKSHAIVDGNARVSSNMRGTPSPNKRAKPKVKSLFKPLKVLTVMLALAGMPRGAEAQEPPATGFSGCSLEDYYEPISGDLLNYATAHTAATMDKVLHDLIAPHNVIPYTSTKTDCWDALSDLDVDPTNPSNVILIYAQRSEPISNQGDSEGWNREHVWPKSYGVGYTGPDTSDLLSLRAADWSVNSARNNRWYDDCLDADVCDVPAHDEAPLDTGKMTVPGTNGLFMPPASSRGDLARSILYMATRYDGEEEDTTDLQVSDCPCDTGNTMGILTTMLRWHEEDPVDDAERERNTKLCEGYQGNRNPYIDYPELAGFIYGEGVGVPEGGCPVCPEKESDDGGSGEDFWLTSSQRFRRGDVAVVGVTSDSPKAVLLLALVDLEPGGVIYVTDNGWTSDEGGWRTGEGTLRYVVPAEGVPKGATLLWSEGGGEASDAMLYALQYRAGSFDEAGSEGTTKGTLPGELEGGPFWVALTHRDNYRWTREEFSGEVRGKLGWLEAISGGVWEGENGEGIVELVGEEGYVDVLGRESCVVGEEGGCGEGEVCVGMEGEKGEEGGEGGGRRRRRRRRLFGNLDEDTTTAPEPTPIVGECVHTLEL